MSTSPLTWRPTNAPLASSRTDDIWFLDPSTGWAVNSNGHILMTADGGASWTKQFSANVYLRCVGFANRDKGWVGTLSSAQRLFHTEDGGTTWKRVDNLPSTSPVFVCGLSVVNESVVYASGTNDPDQAPRMIKTVDGGATWTGWEMSEHATLLVDCFFTTPNRGWVVGGKANVANPSRDDVKPVVLFTEDGGQNWINRVANIQNEFPLGEWGWKIFFLTDLIGFVSLENFSAGAILKTTDGGLTWTRHPVNDSQENANLEGVGFADENHGWTGGWGDASFQSGSSSETLDGANHWQNANHIGRFINRFRFFGNPATLGYASGRTVYKYSSEPVVTGLVEPAQPLQFLSSNEPQESSGPIEIIYTVPQDAKHLKIDIWDRFGKYVRKLLDEPKPRPGKQSAIWNFEDDSGRTVGPGAFIYRIAIDDDAESRIVFKTL
jgi:photosystem II stability/assembly factor-like uncharacterized protein